VRLRLSARTALTLLLLAASSVVTPARTQEPSPQDAQQPAAPVTVPNVFEVATRARIVADSAARAERTIERLGMVGAFTAEID
jgi:hypothetical protein